jgi:hypothetical protein
VQCCLYFWDPARGDWALDWIEVEMLPKLLEYWRDVVVVQLYRLIHFVGGGGSFRLAHDVIF